MGTCSVTFPVGNLVGPTMLLSFKGPDFLLLGQGKDVHSSVQLTLPIRCPLPWLHPTGKFNNQFFFYSPHLTPKGGGVTLICLPHLFGRKHVIFGVILPGQNS